jgi:hypothetical protein
MPRSSPRVRGHGKRSVDGDTRSSTLAAVSRDYVARCLRLQVCTCEKDVGKKDFRGVVHIDMSRRGPHAELKATNAPLNMLL